MLSSVMGTFLVKKNGSGEVFTSRRTGNKYTVEPSHGYTLVASASLMIVTPSRQQAIELLELYDKLSNA